MRTPRSPGSRRERILFFLLLIALVGMTILAARADACDRVFFAKSDALPGCERGYAAAHLRSQRALF